jgi:hypothetical protein
MTLNHNYGCFSTVAGIAGNVRVLAVRWRFKTKPNKNKTIIKLKTMNTEKDQVPQCDKTAVMQSVILPIDLKINNYLEANIKDSYDSIQKWTIINVSGIQVNFGFNEDSNKVFFVEPDISTFNKIRRYTKLDNDCLRGITLTKEWLVKFGFVENDIPKNYVIELEKDNLLYLIVREDNTVICTSEPCMVISMMQIKKIEYVHQLQNFYFALTGRELTVC